MYGYDRVGNVTSLVNAVGPVAASEHGGRVEQSFIYDDLHRLESATGEWAEPGGARNRYTLSLGYDAIHNLTHKTQTHTVGRGSGSNAVTQRRTTYDFDYEYAGTQPHAPTRVGERSFGYDASGRQVTVTPEQGGPRRTVLWDSEDRIRAIQDGGAAVLDEHGNVVDGRGRTTAFTYDHTGQRITKSGAQGHTAYVNPFYTLRNEAIATKHVFVGAARVTSKLVPGEGADELPTETDDVAHYLGRWWQHRSEEGWEHASNVEMNPHYRVPTAIPSPMGLPESNFIYFYHPDHLGSTSFVTDGGGEIYEHVQYFPHGEVWADERSNTERLPYLFTGKEMDQETGLYDFGARMYDPRVGIWESPDPALPEFLEGRSRRGGGASDPVSLSLYCMASWNSLRFVDPDGLDEIDDVVAEWRERGVTVTHIDITRDHELGDFSCSSELAGYFQGLMADLEQTVSGIELPEVTVGVSLSTTGVWTAFGGSEGYQLELGSNRVTGLYNIDSAGGPLSGRPFGFGPYGAGIGFHFAIGPAGSEWEGRSRNLTIGGRGPVGGTAFWTPGGSGFAGVELSLGVGVPGIAIMDTNATRIGPPPPQSWVNEMSFGYRRWLGLPSGL